MITGYDYHQNQSFHHLLLSFSFNLNYALFEVQYFNFQLVNCLVISMFIKESFCHQKPGMLCYSIIMLFYLHYSMHMIFFLLIYPLFILLHCQSLYSNQSMEYLTCFFYAFTFQFYLYLIVIIDFLRIRCFIRQLVHHSRFLRFMTDLMIALNFVS